MYVLTLLSKGVPTKLLKFFWLKIFLICHRCHRHRWSTLSCEYLREFSKKFEMVPLDYSGAGGKLIDVKNQKQKISWHCPFTSLLSPEKILTHGLSENAATIFLKHERIRKTCTCTQWSVTLFSITFILCFHLRGGGGGVGKSPS